MKINQFGGGLNTRLAPQMLGTNMSTVLNNIDTETNVLAPVKKHKVSSQVNGANPHWFTADSEWLSSNTTRDYVEFQKKMYWTDGSNRPQKRKDGTTQNLGIDIPANFALAEVVSNPEKVIKFTASHNLLAPGTPLETNHYLLINVNGTKQSDYLHFSINVAGTVTVLNEDGYTIPSPIVVKTNDSGAFRLVTVGEVEGITFGDIGVEVYRLYKGKFYLIGSLANDTDTIDDSTHDISGNKELSDAGFGVLHGTIQYVHTHVNSVDGSESGPSKLTDELDLTTGGAVTLTMTAPGDSQVDKTRIYRIGGNITTFSLVEEIPSTQLIYTDTTKDTEIEGSILTSQDSAPAPNDLQFLTEAYAMLFAAQGSKLRFTPIGDPNSWPEDFFLSFDAPITGIANVTAGLIVCTTFKTHIVTGTGPLSLAQDILSVDQGCLSHKSIQVREGTAIWASSDGLCQSSGNRVVVVSKDVLGKINLSPIDSIIYDEVYYLLESTGNALLLDYRYGVVFRNLTLDVSSLAIANDVLYGAVGTQLQIIHGSDENETFTYKSPRFIEGSISLNKTYKKVFIYSEGDIIINILIDGETVLTKELTKTDAHQIQVPQQKQRGFFIEFEITGTGTVHEIEYEASSGN